MLRFFQRCVFEAAARFPARLDSNSIMLSLPKTGCRIAACATLIVLAASCAETSEPDQQRPALKDARPTQPELNASVLANMPMNHDDRCFGITTVVEALLDGKVIDDEPLAPEQLAQRVFDSLASDAPVSYPRYVQIKEQMVPVESPLALERLGTLVADLHKHVGVQVIRSPEYEEQYFRACLRTRDELNARLNADPDRTVAFCGAGVRSFPDGTQKDTDHVFLLRKQATGEIVVYDSNAPGAPIPCRIAEKDDFLEVGWKCKYKDTGQATRQVYNSFLDALSFSKLVEENLSPVAKPPRLPND